LQQLKYGTGPPLTFSSCRRERCHIINRALPAANRVVPAVPAPYIVAKNALATGAGVKTSATTMLSRKIVAGLLKAPQQAFSTYKTSTGLVGLAVDLDGRQNLINVSAQILESVKVLLCVCKNSRPWSRRWRISYFARGGVA